MEPFSGKIPKKDPPLCELLTEFSPETNRDDSERLFLLAVTREDEAIPSQSDSSPKLSIPGRQTAALIPACFFSLENTLRRGKNTSPQSSGVTRLSALRAYTFRPQLFLCGCHEVGQLSNFARFLYLSIYLSYIKRALI